MKNNRLQFVDDQGILRLEVEIGRETGVFDTSWYLNFRGPSILLYRACYSNPKIVVSFLYDGNGCFGMKIDITDNIEKSDLELSDILIEQIVAITKNDDVVPVDLRNKIMEVFSQPLLLC